MNVYIALLGKEVLPIYYPIKQFKPDMVYIIGTNDNRKYAKRLIDLLTKSANEELEKSIPKVKDIKFIETEPYGFGTFEICNQIHNQYNSIPPENITYNLTGGTKLMALPAFAVAQSHGSKVIYTDAKNIKTIYSDHFEDSPLECNLTLYEIIALQGQKILEAQQFETLKDQSEIDAALTCRDFICRHWDLYEEIRKEVRNDSTPIQNIIPFSYRYVNYKLKCSQRAKNGNRTLIIENDVNKLFLKITCKNPKEMLLKGVWWELLVANALSTLSADFEVWRNVKFKQVNDEKGDAVKNEIDVLLNIGNRLLFVECKSGKFESGNLHKLNTVKNTYGGEKSKAVLIMAGPLDSNDRKSLLHENAEDNDISILSPSVKQNYASDAFLNQTLPQAIRKTIAKLSL